MSRRRHTDERGVTVVEAALVLPLLFSIILGMTDAGMLVFNNTQVTAGAREGARQGILHYKQADGGSGGTYFTPPCSTLTTDQASICNAIQAHLGTSNFQFSVQCLARAASVGSAQPSPPQESCANARVDTDQIQVTVRWTRQSWTAVLPTSITVTGASTLTILGLPQ
jgi:Flp pilus assembly protein TadG